MTMENDALMRRDHEGPVPVKVDRGPRVSVVAPKHRRMYLQTGSNGVYDALDRQLMASMDWEAPALGRRVRSVAISAAKEAANGVAEQHGARRPGVNGNGKA